jgi:hypothetical protein
LSQHFRDQKLLFVKNSDAHVMVDQAVVDWGDNDEDRDFSRLNLSNQMLDLPKQAVVDELSKY